MPAQRGVQPFENDAGLDTHPARLGIERDDLIHVFAAIEDEGAGDGAERLDQAVGVGNGVVHGIRGAGGGGGSEPAHQRLGAVVAGADAHSLATEDLADIMGMRPVEHERDQRAAVRGVRGTVKLDAGNLGQARQRVGDQRALVSADPIDADRSDPVHGDAEPDRLGDLGRAGLELPGQVGPGRLGLTDGADHVAAADERGHPLEQLAPAVEHADAGRAISLVTGPGVEIGVERAQVHRDLGHRLGSVDHDDGAGDHDHHQTIEGP